jgi:pyridoxine 4-dehydrogenase
MIKIGDLEVGRLGFGAMRITGDGIWGPPRDREESLRVLRRAVELGVTLIDTADSYGPDVSEELIAEALYPYPEGLVIATKGGKVRPGPGQWVDDAGRNICARRAKARSAGCGWSASTSTSSTLPTRTFRSRTPWAR